MKPRSTPGMKWKGRNALFLRHYVYTLTGAGGLPLHPLSPCRGRGQASQLQQADINLYYYNARYYDAALGRFIQADTIIPGAGDSKSYDRYAYVNNNPILYTDPSGHCYTSSGAWIPGGGDAACSFRTSTPAPTESDPFEALVGGSDGKGGFVGPDPLWQMPAYTTNPYDFEVIPFTFHEPRDVFAQTLIDTVPTNRPAYYFCYSASAGPCLIAVTDRIKKHQANPSVREVLGVAIIGGTYPAMDLAGNSLVFPGGYDAYADFIYNSGVPLIMFNDNSGTADGVYGKPYYQDPDNFLYPNWGGLEHFGHPDLQPNGASDIAGYGTMSAPFNLNTYIRDGIWNFFASGTWEWSPK